MTTNKTNKKTTATAEAPKHYGVQRYHVVLTLTEDILGSMPKSKELATNFVLKKGLDKGAISEAQFEEEANTLQDMQERGYTGFRQDDKGVYFRDYAIKGFLKAAALALKTEHMVKNAGSKISQHVFVFPRDIHFKTGNGEIVVQPEGICERPLRAQTMQGPRVSLAKSDVVKAGSTLEFDIEVVASSEFSEETLHTLLGYGKYSGLGQWRNAGYGRFEYKLTAK